MNRNLNVSIIQMPRADLAANLLYLRNSVDSLMAGYVKPELIVGVEMGISMVPQTIPGPATDFLGAIAKKHGIYFIPGTMAESAPELPDGGFYNSCPVFGPDGTLLTVCRKKVPVRPCEGSCPDESNNYCLFHIPEKDITAGVLVCYDQFFPEIPRTLALMGAELIICPSGDPIEFRHIPDILPRARALENELYYIWTCGTGQGLGGTSCGRSVVIDPEGLVVDRCGNVPARLTCTLDLDFVRRKRLCGKDQHLNSLRHFHVAYPFADKLDLAPVYKNMPGLTDNPAAYTERLKEMGVAPFTHELPEPSDSDRLLDELYRKLNN